MLHRRRAFVAALLLLAVLLAPAACRGGPELDGERGDADEPPYTNLAPADSPADRILCVRAEATPLGRGAEGPLEAAAELAIGTTGPPLDRNGLAVTWGGPRFAKALAEIVQRHAGEHDVQFVTTISGETARVEVGPPRPGRFRFWGDWWEKAGEGKETRSVETNLEETGLEEMEPVEMEGGEIQVEDRSGGLAVWAQHRLGGKIRVVVTPVLGSPEPEVDALSVAALSTRFAVPSGGAVLLTTSGDLADRTFGRWFLSRRTDGRLHRLFVILYVHCLN